MGDTGKNSIIGLELVSIWKLVTILVTITGFYLMNEMMIIRENLNPQAKSVFNSFSYHLPKIAQWTVIVSIGRIILQYLTQEFALKLYLKTTVKNTEAYKDKIKPVIANLIWYSFITAFGITRVGYKNDIVPRTLGGTMDSNRAFSERYPHLDMKEIDYLYFHIQFGTKIYSFLKTLILEREFGDFWEMYLHHLLTTLLMVLSLFSNITEIGLVVLLIHDPGDVVLNFMKIYRYMIPKAYKPSIFTAALSIVSMLFWIILRVVIQPISLFTREYQILKNLREYQAYEVTDEILDKLYYLLAAIFSVLFILYIMNVYWSILALRLVTNFIFKGDFKYHHGVKINKRIEKDKINKKNKGKLKE